MKLSTSSKLGEPQPLLRAFLAQQIKPMEEFKDGEAILRIYILRRFW